MLPKKNRITTNFEFNVVKKYGQLTNGSIFRISTLKDKYHPEYPPRFGIIITNKITKSSVKRHRIKRLINQYLYDNITRFPVGYMVVIIVKSDIIDKTYEDIVTCFDQILSKISFT